MFVLGPHALQVSKVLLFIPLCLLMAIIIRDLGKKRVYLFAPISRIKVAVETKVNRIISLRDYTRTCPHLSRKDWNVSWTRVSWTRSPPRLRERERAHSWRQFLSVSVFIIIYPYAVWCSPQWIGRARRFPKKVSFNSLIFQDPTRVIAGSDRPHRGRI